MTGEIEAASDGDRSARDGATGVTSPMEAHGSYRGLDWSPQRLVFNQNLETFAERVGLIVGLQSNGKLSQDQAYAQIRKLWKDLRASRDNLLEGLDGNGEA